MKGEEAEAVIDEDRGDHKIASNNYQWFCTTSRKA